MARFFIQKAIKHKGALRKYVKTKYGKKGFTEEGNIKPSIEEKLAHEKGKIGKRARLAITLRRLRTPRKDIVY